MSGSINKVILIGNLGKDPEIRKTQDGRDIANFSIATSESWKDKQSGERKSKTEWHNIVVFQPGLVSLVSQYVKKGTKLYIEGSLQTRKWQDKSGNDRYSTEIVLNGFNCSLTLLSSGEPRTEEEKAMFKEDKQAVEAMDTGSEFKEDEIPF